MWRDTMSKDQFLVKDCLKLGFGLMRLPREGGDMNRPVDLEQMKKMVDDFLAAGGKYFDTAFIYEGSEEAAKATLCSRHPRDTYYLATKLNAASFCCSNEQDAKAELKKSLERTGAGYFDFYLLHGLDQENLADYDKYGLWDYLKSVREEGLIRHMGFSFHDSPELLDRILAEHPEAEFVQLQINYADWDDGVVQSKGCYEIAAKYGKPIIVMEPVKGGSLANPPKPVEDILKAADPDVSAASWAVRFAASLPGVMIVLSGMSSTEQMQDNLSYMKEFKPLSEEETNVVEHAREALHKIDQIPCTSCHYCAAGCPVNMHIPEIFNVMNVYKLYGDLDRSKGDYTWRPGGPKASECVRCGQCEDACPQHLPIISLLEEVAETLE